MNAKRPRSRLERRFIAIASGQLRAAAPLAALLGLIGAGWAGAVGRLWPALAGFGLAACVVLGAFLRASFLTHFPRE